jgi:hypothetical protein
MIVAVIALLVVVTAAGFGYWRGASEGWFGAEREAGVPHATPLPADFAASRDAGAEQGALILFGDLHVHTTYSTDAFLWALPMNGGRGAHPVGEACDFARFCSALDFWAITDHAEASTPLRWARAKEAVRQCQATAGAGPNPDLISFIGFEWTQVGQLPQDHYGHKNVIFRDLEDARVAARPIAAAGVPTQTLRTQAAGISPALPLRNWEDRQPYFDFNRFIRNAQKVPDCPADRASKDLPADCFEQAATPGDLIARLESQGLSPLIIPHGSSWGFYTPQGTSWDKQLAPDMRPEAFRLIEVFSGHGNSEEYRPWRDVEFSEDGQSAVCPPPVAGYVPSCWRAGEIIAERCRAEGAAAPACEERAAAARANAANMGIAFHLSISGEEPEDLLDAGQCTDCFLPSFNHRPAASVQYGLAISRFDEDAAEPARFRWGFIASSDNHRARPGTGYKANDRRLNTESSGPVDEASRGLLIGRSLEKTAQSVLIPRENLMRMAGFQLTELERQSAFFTTGGLAAVHAPARSREAIWNALENRQTYATSGPRILLWFDLVDGRGANEKRVMMGGETTRIAAPQFEVRAMGAFKQKPGCPDFSAAGMDAERLKTLCSGECFHPSDERMKITRFEVVRIRPQAVKGEAVEALIEDPYLSLPCADEGLGCVARFSDPEFAKAGRDAIYYVRAIQEEEPVINARPIDCIERGPDGRCLKVKQLCYGDYRSGDSDCTAPAAHRAWSSPIYVRHGRRA